MTFDPPLRGTSRWNVPSAACRTTNPLTNTRTPGSALPVMLTTGLVVVDGTASSWSAGAIESRVTSTVAVAVFPARSVALSEIELAPSVRGAVIEKEPSARTQARRPPTATSTLAGSYVSFGEIDSAIRPRTFAMSEFVGVEGAVAVITGGRESRMIVSVAAASFPGTCPRVGSRWNQSAARTVTTFVPSARERETLNRPSGSVVMGESPTKTEAPDGIAAKFMAPPGYRILDQERSARPLPRRPSSRGDRRLPAHGWSPFRP